MPLDFHLAKTKQQAPYESALGSFDEQTHRIIFERSKEKLENNFPLFNRLSDYYKDAHFAHEELAALQAEIAQLKITFSKNPAVLTQLDGIDRLCEKALAESQSIWVFCD